MTPTAKNKATSEDTPTTSDFQNPTENMSGGPRHDDLGPTNEDIKSTQKTFLVEFNKALITGSLDYIKNTAQILQALTTLLLTAYIALLVGFRRDFGINDTLTLCAAFSPIVFWVSSLGIGVYNAIDGAFRPVQYVMEDYDQTVAAYEQVFTMRRKQMIWPAALTGLGMFAFALVYFLVFVTTISKSPQPTQLNVYELGKRINFLDRRIKLLESTNKTLKQRLDAVAKNKTTLNQ